MEKKKVGKHGLTFSLNEVQFDTCNIDFVPVSLETNSNENSNVDVTKLNDTYEKSLSQSISKSEDSFETMSLATKLCEDVKDFQSKDFEENKCLSNYSENRVRNHYQIPQIEIDTEKHWFYYLSNKSKCEWKPFTILDSQIIENKYQDLRRQNFVNVDPEDYVISVEGGRYDVSLMEKIMKPVYWDEPSMDIRRGTWFYRIENGYKYIPYSESESEIIELKYQDVVRNNLWNQSFELKIQSEGRFTFNSPHTIQWRRYQDYGSDTNEEDIVVCRGIASFQHNLEESDSSNIDHVIFVIHGIGPVYDLHGSGIIDCVKKMRFVSKQMHNDHFSAHDGRIEVLPVSWHDILHTREISIDNDLSKITLKSVPRLRSFTNSTLVDVLCYSSPKYANTLLSNVAAELNRLRHLFISRNPMYEGSFSIVGHSLGSVIAFDLTCLQDESTTKLVNVSDPASIPRFEFDLEYVFALGSPISLFLTSRGYSALGLDFKLNCKGFYNIFHPFDPVAYRIEPIVTDFDGRPVVIPHHKGRKRLHLELKDNIMRMGSDIKTKLMHTLKLTWNSLQEFAQSHKSIGNVDEWDNNELMRTLSQMDHSIGERDDFETNHSELNINFGALNNGKRIDYVLQEAPLESFNDYLFALGSHACYWESEDTILMMMKEIYATMNVSTNPKIDKSRPIVSNVPQSHLPPPLHKSRNFQTTNSALSKVQSVPTINSYESSQRNYNILPPSMHSNNAPVNFFMPQNTDENVSQSQLPSNINELNSTDKNKHQNILSQPIPLPPASLSMLSQKSQNIESCHISDPSIQSITPVFPKHNLDQFSEINLQSPPNELSYSNKPLPTILPPTLQKSQHIEHIPSISQRYQTDNILKTISKSNTSIENIKHIYSHDKPKSFFCPNKSDDLNPNIQIDENEKLDSFDLSSTSSINQTKLPPSMLNPSKLESYTSLQTQISNMTIPSPSNPIVEPELFKTDQFPHNTPILPPSMLNPSKLESYTSLQTQISNMTIPTSSHPIVEPELSKTDQFPRNTPILPPSMPNNPPIQSESSNIIDKPYLFHRYAQDPHLVHSTNRINTFDLPNMIQPKAAENSTLNFFSPNISTESNEPRLILTSSGLNLKLDSKLQQPLKNLETNNTEQLCLTSSMQNNASIELNSNLPPSNLSQLHNSNNDSNKPNVSEIFDSKSITAKEFDTKPYMQPSYSMHQLLPEPNQSCQVSFFQPSKNSPMPNKSYDSLSSYFGKGSGVADSFINDPQQISSTQQQHDNQLILRQCALQIEPMKQTITNNFLPSLQPDYTKPPPTQLLQQTYTTSQQPVQHTYTISPSQPQQQVSNISQTNCTNPPPTNLVPIDPRKQVLTKIDKSRTPSPKLALSLNSSPSSSPGLKRSPRTNESSNKSSLFSSKPLAPQSGKLFQKKQ